MAASNSAANAPQLAEPWLVVLPAADGRLANLLPGLPPAGRSDCPTIRRVAQAGVAPAQAQERKNLSDVQLDPTVTKGPNDFSQTAFDIVARSTGTPTTDDLAKSQRAAKGGKPRAESLTDEQRAEVAAKAAAARWTKPVTQT